MELNTLKGDKIIDIILKIDRKSTEKIHIENISSL